MAIDNDMNARNTTEVIFVMLLTLCFLVSYSAFQTEYGFDVRTPAFTPISYRLFGYKAVYQTNNYRLQPRRLYVQALAISNFQDAVYKH